MNSADDEGFRRLLINLISATPNKDIRADAFGTLEEVAKACKATADEFCKIAPSLSILTVWEMGPPEIDDGYNPVSDVFMAPLLAQLCSVLLAEIEFILILSS